MTGRPTVTDDRTKTLLTAELAEAREELRRTDGRARDLLVIAGLAVTVVGGVGGLVDRVPPPPVAAGFLVAAVLWLASVIQVLLVVRPVIVPTVGGFADQRGCADLGHTSEIQWQSRRWCLLSGIVLLRYQRIRRAVDLLLWAAGLVVVSGVLWVLTCL